MAIEIGRNRLAVYYTIEIIRIARQYLTAGYFFDKIKTRRPLYESRAIILRWLFDFGLEIRPEIL